MHMRKSTLSLTLLALVAGSAATALAQGMPTTQPKFMHIFREQIKPGRAGEHAKWEAGWPAAFEKAKSPYHYIALQSITGPPEVWYVSPLANQAAYGEMMARSRRTRRSRRRLERLSKGDAEFLAEQSAMQAVAMPELSHGAFPVSGRCATGRSRPSGSSRATRTPGRPRPRPTRLPRPARPRTPAGAPTRWWRGAPGGTYLFFSSVGAFGDFDKTGAEGEATRKGATPDELGVLGKFTKESVLLTRTATGSTPARAT